VLLGLFMFKFLTGSVKTVSLLGPVSFLDIKNGKLYLRRDSKGCFKKMRQTPQTSGRGKIRGVSFPCIMTGADMC